MIILPRKINDDSLQELLAVVEGVQRSSDAVIDIDASNLVFIEPIGICVFASMCETLANNGQKLNFHNMVDSIKSYLSRMDLQKYCVSENEPTTTRLNRAGSLIEVHSISEQQDIESSARKISKCLVGTTPDYDESALFDPMTGYQPHTQLEDNLIYLFNELLENSLSHGKRHGYRSAKVWVASQYFPSTDFIKLGIVDNGCGFFRTLKSHPKKPDTDTRAIEIALEPFTSCNRDVGLMNDSYNEGVGLTVISRMIAEATGSLRIFSGDALNIYDSGDLIDVKISDNSAWSGVGISISLPRKKLKYLLYRDVVRHLRNENSDESDEDLNIQFI